MKEKLLERFKELFTGKRLLAVQLDGFSHKIVYDDGSKDSAVKFIGYSSYSPEQKTDDFNTDEAIQFFRDVPHHEYQNNADEIVYVQPSER